MPPACASSGEVQKLFSYKIFKISRLSKFSRYNFGKYFAEADSQNLCINPYHYHQMELVTYNAKV